MAFLVLRTCGGGPLCCQAERGRWGRKLSTEAQGAASSPDPSTIRYSRGK